MSQVFGKEYASAYDILYQEKDYNAECNLIEKIIHEYSSHPVKTILDLGCGTGNHTLRLAERGYQVCGVDRSEEMLSIARSKSQNKILSCEFFQSDIREFRVSRKFDAVIMMFAVLGYHLENDDVLQALHTVSEHLNPGGLFICDVWYGPAVLTQKPGEKIKIIKEGERQIIRVSSGDLDIFHHRVEVIFHVWDIIGESVVTEINESHIMRFFFPQEIKYLLESSDFNCKLMGKFPDYKNSLSEDTWNAMVIAIRR